MSAPTMPGVRPCGDTPPGPSRALIGAVIAGVIALSLVAWLVFRGPAAPKPLFSAGTTTTAAPTATTTAAGSSSAQAPARALDTSAVPGEPAGAAYFGPHNFWHTTITDAPVDANSGALVKNLAHQAASLYGGVAAFNAYHYNVAFYTVGADVPRRDVIWDNCQQKQTTPAGLLGPDGQFAQVPIPDEAVASPGSDAELTVFSPSLDKVWEFWQAHKQADGWHACWGGRMDNVSTTADGYFSNGFGASATGMTVFAGAVSIADVKAGHIDHVLALALPSTAKWDNVSWPAQRSDGNDVGPDVIPEGTRFRLDPAINVDSLPLSPVAKLVAKAAQKYGFVITDKASAVSVIGESGAAIKAASGTDPWASLLGGVPDYLVMKNFPWGQLQAMPRDFGKPF